MAALKRAHLFVCCQRTEATAAYASELWHSAGPSVVAYHSLPSFNQADANSQAEHDWAALLRGRPNVSMDVPIYLESVKEAFASMLAAPVFATALRWARARPVESVVDVGLKMHIDPLQKNQLQNTLDLLEVDEARVCERIVNFRTFYLQLQRDSYGSKAEWRAALRPFLAPDADLDAPNALHTLNVLTLFGATPERARYIAEACAARENKPIGAIRLRFLSKALCAFGIVGCITDAVHMVLAMLGLPLSDGTHFRCDAAASAAVYTGPDERTLVRVLRDFGDPSSWQPHYARIEHVLGDHESDDRAACAILATVRRHFHLPPPRVYAQLQEDVLPKISLPRGFVVVYDRHARNTEKVLHAEPATPWNEKERREVQDWLGATAADGEDAAAIGHEQHADAEPPPSGAAAPMDHEEVRRRRRHSHSPPREEPESRLPRRL